MYTLKEIARRGTLAGAAFGMAVAAVVPAVLPTGAAFADALNPLTDRSLTLSSGSPGWSFTDGSGNPTYAPPNSGANGQKTGNTFSFKVSSPTTPDTLKAMTFQYCTTPAGNCMGPGDNGYSSGDPSSNDAVRKTNAAGLADKTSDLEIALDGNQSEISNFSTYVDATGNGSVKTVPAPGSAGSNYMVYYRTSDSGTPADASDDTWAQSTGWVMTRQIAQFGNEADGESTNKYNQISLVKTAGDGFAAGTLVKVVFFGTNNNYITNPGSREFFVKINTWNDASARLPANVIDGGVTVANVMNLSIEIQTKVLETMQFSVGTVDPYTLAAAADDGGTPAVNEAEESELYAASGKTQHGTCEPVLPSMSAAATTGKNVLQMGDENGEFSLRTDATYSTHSYWRLSSNSSAGATVYYSGVTLSNTVNDKIDEIGNGDGVATAPNRGTEQFGLAFANATSGTREVSYATERNSGYAPGQQLFGNLENGADNGKTGVHASVTDPLISNLGSTGYHTPRLSPLVAESAYAQGVGAINANYWAASSPIATQFAFDKNANTIPAAIATENDQVVDCVTGKMRYIANIAATTPAGIYTTKINYIAAPQY